MPSTCSPEAACGTSKRAFADLLRKHGRPVDLKTALRGVSAHAAKGNPMESEAIIAKATDDDKAGNDGPAAFDVNRPAVSASRFWH
jgi:hypothetical protein